MEYERLVMDDFGRGRGRSKKLRGEIIRHVMTQLTLDMTLDKRLWSIHI